MVAKNDGSTVETIRFFSASSFFLDFLRSKIDLAIEQVKIECRESHVALLCNLRFAGPSLNL